MKRDVIKHATGAFVAAVFLTFAHGVVDYAFFGIPLCVELFKLGKSLYVESK